MLDDNFFNSLGLENISDERKQQLSEQLAELVENRLAFVMAERMTEEEMERFDDIADNEGDEAAAAYLEKVMPDYEDLVQAEAQAVKQEFVNDMQLLLDHVEENPEE